MFDFEDGAWDSGWKGRHSKVLSLVQRPCDGPDVDPIAKTWAGRSYNFSHLNFN